MSDSWFKRSCQLFVDRFLSPGDRAETVLNPCKRASGLETGLDVGPATQMFWFFGRNFDSLCSKSKFHRVGEKWVCLFVRFGFKGENRGMARYTELFVRFKNHETWRKFVMRLSVEYNRYICRYGTYYTVRGVRPPDVARSDREITTAITALSEACAEFPFRCTTYFYFLDYCQLIIFIWRKMFN